MTPSTPVYPAALLTLFSPLVCLGEAIWSDSFRDESDPERRFDGGSLVSQAPVSAASGGYTLQATTDVVPGGFQVLTLARFDPAGGMLWSNRLDPDGTTLQVIDLIADSEDTNRFFASANEPGNIGFRFGLFAGDTAAPVFVKAASKSAALPHQVEYFTGSLVGASIDNGTSIDAVVLDGNGDTVFDKRYTSPSFVSGSPLIVQSYIRGLLASRNQYLTSVSQAAVAVNGTSVDYTMTLLPFFTDLDGEMVSSARHAFNSGVTSAVPFPSAISDDALLYRIPASDILTPGSPKTHLVKLDPDGSLGWAQTVDGGTFIQVFPTPDDLYLAGFVPQPGGALGSTDAAVLRLDPDTGDLLSHVVFDTIGDNDSPNLVVHNDNVYVTINSFDLADPSAVTTTLVKLTRDLAAPSAIQYTDAHLTAILTPDGPLNGFERLVFSPCSDKTGEVRAISLDLNLNPVASCPQFEAVIVNTTTPLSLSALSVTSGSSTVTANDIMTALTDSSLPVAACAVTGTKLCEPVTSAGRLVIELTPGDPSAGVLRFATANGVTYSVRSRTNLDSPFVNEIGTVAGDGGVKEFPISLTDPRRFYVVSPPPPATP